MNELDMSKITEAVAPIKSTELITQLQEKYPNTFMQRETADGTTYLHTLYDYKQDYTGTYMSDTILITPDGLAYGKNSETIGTQAQAGLLDPIIKEVHNQHEKHQGEEEWRSKETFNSGLSGGDFVISSIQGQEDVLKKIFTKIEDNGGPWGEEKEVLRAAAAKENLKKTPSIDRL